ncbi:hypothetical protein ACS0TY_022363 [Phlomoides rotata]
MRWDFYTTKKTAREEADLTWELGKKLGFTSTVHEETIISNIEERITKDPDNKKVNKRGKGSKQRPGLSLWGNGNFDWAHRNSDYNSEGIISIWNKNVFQKNNSWDIPGMLVVNGILIEDGTNLTIVNVYAPSSATNRWALWDTILCPREQYKDSCFCVMGDFNSIRAPEERQGREDSRDIRDINKFNNFIIQSNLVDIQVIGRYFTWYRPNGSCKSKLDRVLVNSEWINRWPNFIEHPSLKDLVQSSWNSENINGWGGFVVKEKLKRMKADIRIWKESINDKLDTSIKKRKEDFFQLDLLDDTFDLDEEESGRISDLMKDLFVDLKWKDAALFQKSRAKWVAEGDCNSKLFHSFINRRNKRNALHGLWVEDRWEDSVNRVTAVVFNHFKSHYSNAGVSSWWGDIYNLYRGTFSEGVSKDFVKRVGNGDSTKFWSGQCVKGGSLKNQFHRLFRLSNKKSALISEMGSWENDIWVWNWEWKRPLSSRNLSLFDNLLALLNRYKLSQNEEDYWN